MSRGIPSDASPSSSAKTTILALRNYSTSLWKYRNGVVHGHTEEEAKQREFTSLQSKVEAAYLDYQADRFLVSPQFSHLFMGKTLNERLSMDRDSMSSWLQSLQAAKTHQQTFRKSLPKISTFLRKRSDIAPPPPGQLKRLHLSSLGLFQNPNPPGHGLVVLFMLLHN